MMGKIRAAETDSWLANKLTNSDKRTQRRVILLSTRKKNNPVTKQCQLMQVNVLLDSHQSPIHLHHHPNHTNLWSTRAHTHTTKFLNVPINKIVTTHKLRLLAHEREHKKKKVLCEFFNYPTAKLLKKLKAVIGMLMDNGGSKPKLIWSVHMIDN